LGRGGSSPLIRTLRRFILLGAAAAAAASLSGSVAAAPGIAPRAAPTSEVIVTLHAPALAAYGRTLTSVRQTYERQIAAAQAAALRNLRHAIPSLQVVWRYRIVADGFDLVVPTADVPELRHITGIAKVWPDLTYTSLAVRRTAVTRAQAVKQGPQVIGADKLWGANLSTAGNGMKIGIIDDGVDARHVYFDPSGFSYPAGFPKGLTKDTTSKVIVQRTFAPPKPVYEYASSPFDPSRNGSFHATHVAGIAAGDHDTPAGALFLSGIAPMAFLGNYKALTIPTPGFGLDGNSGSIAAAIEQAVKDGMNVINLSLGEPEIAPSRDFVVHAIDAAAAAGVVPVIAGDNQFDQYAYGSISSPANSPGAITVAATTESGTIADFSSGGPTPVSLQLKPDVSAPGVAITSSLPVNQGGPFGELSGTSMAAPQVAGGVALLMQRHPSWTVAEIKSALVLTGNPVRDLDGHEVSVLREGGGLVDLVRADDPLIFAAPTSITFPVDGGTVPIDLSDAGGGAGSWSVAVRVQDPRAGVSIRTSPEVSVPGRISVTASVSSAARNGDITGFVVLTHGSDARRIPFWVEVDHPLLASEPSTQLTHPGIYEGTTLGGESKVRRYRYPTAGDTAYPGPEVVYRVHIARPVANFGVAVLSGRAVPHVVFAGDENHLVGFTGLPTTLNPYLSSFGESRPIAGAVLPAPGYYDIVFDTRSATKAGPFTFRYWVNDTTPPALRVLSTAGGKITVAITDRGAGVDPDSVTATLDGRIVDKTYADGRLTLPATPGSHLLIVTASDYQEAKNMEDVPAIKPNTATLRRTVVVS
jgi:subtilisin family serine protease